MLSLDEHENEVLLPWSIDSLDILQRGNHPREESQLYRAGAVKLILCKTLYEATNPFFGSSDHVWTNCLHRHNRKPEA